MSKYLKFLGILAVLMLVLSACGGATPPAATPEPAMTEAPTEAVVATPEATEAPAAVEFVREETLYTGGKQWGPVNNWNPFLTGNYAMGTLGLVYETLFLYDPLTDEYMPWLAESGSWTDDKTYVVKVRQGLTWSDGETLTADDVKFTFELGKTATLNFSTLWDTLDSIEKTDADTLTFHFSSPKYQEFANILYTLAIVPQHIWGTRSPEDVSTGANEKPIGSGAYLYESYDDTKMVWVRNDNWWAIKEMNLKMAPKRIVDLVNTSNENSLGLVLQGNEDLNNNYLPGVSNLVQGGYGLKTYYPEAPYHLAANTAWLDINLQKKPMDDVEFRKAMAYAINVGDIVSRDYGNMVAPSTPTGLLPVWQKYDDPEVIKNLGITYDPAKAKSTLAAAGYADRNGDGFVEAPDGSEIALKIIVPNGWSDWMTAIQIISKSCQDVGINVQPDYPDYPGYLDARLQGTFDLAIDNQKNISNTPYDYYHWMFYDKLEDIATTQGGNYGRYNNPDAFKLVEDLNATKIDDLEGMKAVISELETIQLTNLPVIPLWYNGAWAQFSSKYWTGWPCSADDCAHYFPVTWNGYWNMTSLLMLSKLQPTPKQ